MGSFSEEGHIPILVSSATISASDDTTAGVAKRKIEFDNAGRAFARARGIFFRGVYWRNSGAHCDLRARRKGAQVAASVPALLRGNRYHIVASDFQLKHDQIKSLHNHELQVFPAF